MMRFRIGIVGWNTSENTFGVTKAYAAFLAQFGDVLTLHPQQDMVEGLDLLVLPGGQDISSHLYGEVPNYYNSNADLMKEFFMRNNLPQYIEAGVPIFGICLGMQQLYVHFGGKMLQDIDDHPRSASSDRGELVHGLHFMENYQDLRPNHKKGTVYVNSLHHQACDPDSLPDCLDIVAFSSPLKKEHDAQYVEVICHREYPIWGVQYHPEEINDILSAKIINTLLYARTAANV